MIALATPARPVWEIRRSALFFRPKNPVRPEPSGVSGQFYICPLRPCATLRALKKSGSRTHRRDPLAAAWLDVWRTGEPHLVVLPAINTVRDLNSTFLQPFIAYTTKTKTTFGANMEEDTYDWENHQWTAPVNLMLTQLVRIGKMPVSFQIGGRYYADKPAQGPHWGLRFTVTFIFPK